MPPRSSSSILLTSLIGDALCLGPHWIYDQDAIAQTFGLPAHFAAPASAYHPGKHAGDFTHYGDQTLVLLQSLANLGRFDAPTFAAAWRAFWENPATLSYRDGATRTTLENLRSGQHPAASPSQDIAGASRLAPLFLLAWENPDDLAAAARAQAALTHGHPSVAEVADFFARVTWLVREGTAIPEALRTIAAQQPWSAPLHSGLAAAAASSTSPQSDAAALTEHGLACGVADAFPALCHLLLRHPHHAATALIANAAAGGDSAARGLLLGLVYGAQPHADPLPEAWTSGLRAQRDIAACLDQLALAEKHPEPPADSAQAERGI